VIVDLSEIFNKIKKGLYRVPNYLPQLFHNAANITTDMRCNAMLQREE